MEHLDTTMLLNPMLQLQATITQFKHPAMDLTMSTHMVVGVVMVAIHMAVSMVATVATHMVVLVVYMVATHTGRVNSKNIIPLVFVSHLNV